MRPPDFGSPSQFVKNEHLDQCHRSHKCFWTRCIWVSRTTRPISVSIYIYVYIYFWNCQLDDHFVFWQFQLKNTAPLAEVGQAKQPLPQAGGRLLEFVEQGRFQSSWVCVGSRDCLLVLFLFVSFGRTQWPQPLHRTKKKTGDIACLFLLFLCLFVCLFICLLACLFVCLILFSFVSFLVSLLFDDRCSDKSQNLDEYFDKKSSILSILVCVFKTHNFWGVISGSDNDCQCFYTTKTADFMISPYKLQKKVWRLKASGKTVQRDKPNSLAIHIVSRQHLQIRARFILLFLGLFGKCIVQVRN